MAFPTDLKPGCLRFNLAIEFEPAGEHEILAPSRVLALALSINQSLHIVLPEK